MRNVPTEAEKRLWWHLRDKSIFHDVHFRRQVRLGRYIVDFASHRVRIVIEIDGGQDNENPKDDVRTTFLQAEGYRVLRFWNSDVLANIEGVLQEIQRAITSTPTPDPSPQGGGERRMRPI